MIQSYIDWTPLILDHWKELLFKQCVTINNGRDYKNIESTEGVPVIGSGGQFTYCTEEMYNGEVIFLGRKGTIDKPIYYKGPFWAVDTMFYAIPNKKFCAKYLYYLSTCFPFKGISTQTALPSMTQTALKNVVVFTPSLAGQQRMVTYLDTKLSEIDHQVSILTSKRDAYLRLKKSIINHAVTRGLNPNVKMKDSGIEWIGEVPEHWEVKRLKDVVECNAKSLGENTPKDSIIKYVEISDVYHVHGINNIQSLMFGEAPSRARRITQKGDIIISTVRTYLKAIAKIEDDDIIVSTGFAVLHPTKCNGEYLAYYILSESFINRVEMLSKGTSYPAINASDLVSINVLIPPLPRATRHRHLPR